jgi:hypothetical protein
MTALALELRPLRRGWAVDLTDGRELARFIGPGAKRRAETYAAGISRRSDRDDGRMTSWIRRLATRKP